MSQTGIGVGDRRAVVPRTFAWSGEPQGDRLRWFAAGLREVMLDQGYAEVETPGPDVAVVLHFVDPEAAKPYRRKNAPTFVVVLAELDAPADDMLRTGYPLLVRGLANLCVMVSPTSDGSIAQFVTLEQGTYAIDTGIGDDPYFFKSVFSRVEPLASSRLVIGNEFTDDLPDAMRAGDDVTRQITRGRTTRGARSVAGCVPDRGDPLRPRSAPREAVVRHRRPQLRQRERTPARRRAR